MGRAGKTGREANEWSPMEPAKKQSPAGIIRSWIGLGGTAVFSWLAMTPWLRDLQQGHHGGMGYPEYLYAAHASYWLGFGLLFGLGVVFALRREPGMVWRLIAAGVAVTVFAFFGIFFLELEFD